MLQHDRPSYTHNVYGFLNVVQEDHMRHAVV